MSQNRAVTSMSGRKREPIAYAMNPASVAQIGSAMGNHASDAGGKILHGASESMDAGRGFEAPMDAGRTVHRSGSQGRK